MIFEASVKHVVGKFLTTNIFMITIGKIQAENILIFRISVDTILPSELNCNALPDKVKFECKYIDTQNLSEKYFNAENFSKNIEYAELERKIFLIYILNISILEVKQFERRLCCCLNSI